MTLEKPCACSVQPEKIDAGSGENILKLPPGLAFLYVCRSCDTSWLPAEEERKIDKYHSLSFLAAAPVIIKGL
jgi:hypothetical protein